MLLDELMPEFTEIHSVRISAPPDRALEAVKPAPLGEMPLVRLLFAIRSLPARIWGKRGLPAEKATSLYGQMLHFGFTQLAEEPGRGVVCGGIGQMFEPRGGLTQAVQYPRSILASRGPGYARESL